MSEKSAILPEEIRSAQTDTESVFDETVTDLASLIIPHGHLKGKSIWRVSRRVRVGLRNSFFCRSYREWWRGWTEAEIDVEYVDVLCGTPAVVISDFEPKGFTFSETVHGKRLQSQTLSEGVVDISQFQDCEFSKLQFLPLHLLLKNFSRSVVELYQARYAARA